MTDHIDYVWRGCVYLVPGANLKEEHKVLLDGRGTGGVDVHATKPIDYAGSSRKLE